MDTRRSSANRGTFIRHREGDQEIVVVFGDVDLENQGEFRNVLSEAWASSPSLLIDLRNCTYMGSSGVYVLAQCAKRRDSSMRLLPSPHVERVLALVGLSHLVSADPTPTA